MRIALDQLYMLDATDRNHVLGVLLVGTPDDQVESLVSRGKRILLQLLQELRVVLPGAHGSRRRETLDRFGSGRQGNSCRRPVQR